MFMAWHKPTLEHTWVINTARVYGAVRVNGPGAMGRGVTAPGLSLSLQGIILLRYICIVQTLTGPVQLLVG